MHPRTKRQKEVLDYITRFMDRNGYEPSYQQIARHLGVSSRAGIQRHIASLESQGLITRRREDGSFGIELLMRKMISDTVCGIELIEVAEKNGRFTASNRSIVTIPRYLIGSLSPDDVFGFKVPDHSMVGRQICEDDIVLFERRSYARRGETVVVQTDDGQTMIGLYFQHGPETEIRMANEQFQPLVFPADEVKVQGVMRGLLRPFPSNDYS